jgi:membrane fusion protein, copper/silver efflux system
MSTNGALPTTLPTDATTPNSVGVVGNVKPQAKAALSQEIELSPLEPAPPQMTGRQELRLIFLTIIRRFSFVAIVAGIGVFICYWDAVKLHVNRWTHPRATVARQVPAGKEFFCPMEPQVTRTNYEANGDVPNCPICGMPLSLHDKAAEEELPPGITGRVTLSPERIAMAGIKTATIGYRPMSRLTKSMGHIINDESRVSRVVSRVVGYVEKLHVNNTFARVHRGDLLAEIHSPEIYNAARELLLALKDNADSELIASTRRRLLRLGVEADDIDHMAAAAEAVKNVTIRASQDGYIMEKNVVVGESVEPKTTLFEIADLSSVFVEAEVYENDLSFLSLGQAVEAKVDAWPQRTFRGKLVAIYPQTDMAMQTNRIRAQLDNAGDELRPGMVAHVTIDTALEKIEPYKSLAIRLPPVPLGDGKGAKAKPMPPPEYGGTHPWEWYVARESKNPSAGTASAGTSTAAQISSQKKKEKKKEERKVLLVVPENAVIDTGDKKIVYVERTAGRYEGHEVELGTRHDGFFVAIKGLKAGDKVAAAGSFLVDAETRLNPAVASTYFGASGGQQGVVVPASAEKIAGNDWLKAGQQLPESSDDDMKNVKQLIKVDCSKAMLQRICPVLGVPLGSMGVPVKMTLRGKTLFVCCRGCIAKARRSPVETLKKLEIIMEIARQAAVSGCG